MGIERLRWMLGTVAVALLRALVLAPAADADFPSLYGGDVSCAAQPANGDVRLCGGETTTWDGKTQIDLNVVLPPQPSTGADGPYPLIGVFHGWGGHKIGLEDARVQDWAEARLRRLQHERPRLGRIAAAPRTPTASPNPKPAPPATTTCWTPATRSATPST